MNYYFSHKTICRLGIVKCKKTRHTFALSPASGSARVRRNGKTETPLLSARDTGRPGSALPGGPLRGALLHPIWSLRNAPAERLRINIARSPTRHEHLTRGAWADPSVRKRQTRCRSAIKGGKYGCTRGRSPAPRAQSPSLCFAIAMPRRLSGWRLPPGRQLR